MKALAKRKTDYDECDRHRSRKQSLVQPRQESVKETMPPVISVVVHRTQSHTPTLPLYRATRTVFLFFPHIVRILRHRMSPYSYDRATIGLLDIRDMLYSLKPRGVCTTWPCCSAIPGVSVGQTNGRSALYLARAGTASRSARVRRLRRAHGTSILRERRSQRHCLRRRRKRVHDHPSFILLNPSDPNHQRRRNRK
jgi:hypothetical protein